MKKIYNNIIYGVQPVYEFIKYKYNNIYEVYILYDKIKIFKHKYLVKLLYKKKINVNYINKNKFNKLYNIKNINHQNIIAIIKSYPFLNLNQLIIKLDLKNKKNITLLMLDRIQDPQNLGSIMRISVCFDVQGIIIFLLYITLNRLLIIK